MTVDVSDILVFLHWLQKYHHNVDALCQKCQNSDMTEISLKNSRNAFFALVAECVEGATLNTLGSHRECSAMHGFHICWNAYQHTFRYAMDSCLTFSDIHMFILDDSSRSTSCYPIFHYVSTHNEIGSRL